MLNLFEIIFLKGFADFFFIIFAGMGTKIRCKSYLPGYHPMIDLNENAKGCWSRCYEDNMLSGHLCNGFMLRPVNAYSEYDKEMLKRTMLEHEAIFRKQVSIFTLPYKLFETMI